MKKEILIPMIGLLVLSAIMAPVMAKTAATKEPISFTLENITTIPSGKMWLTNDNIQQIKKMKQVGTVSGYFDGTMEVLVSMTLNWTSGEGTGHGKFMIKTDDGSIGGTFRIEGNWATSYIIGTIVGTDSTGIYEGKKIMCSLEQTELDEVSFDGIILSPRL